LHKLCGFRVANLVLSLFFAFPRYERFTARHLQAVEVLMLCQATVPPLLMFLHARRARHDSGAGFMALLQPFLWACCGSACSSCCWSGYGVGMSNGGVETFDSTNHHHLNSRDKLNSTGTASGLSNEYLGQAVAPQQNSNRNSGGRPHKLAVENAVHAEQVCDRLSRGIQ